MEIQLSFGARVALAFKVLFDGAFANRVNQAALATLPAPVLPAAQKTPEPDTRAHLPAALSVLAMLQREGRFVDFLEEDITSFPDADVGAAARVVHEGCRKVLRQYLKATPVMTQQEGDKVTVAAGFDASRIRLTGNVVGQAPFSGTLKHRGWEAKDVTLPAPPKGMDTNILAPAEVEL